MAKFKNFILLIFTCFFINNAVYANEIIYTPDEKYFSKKMYDFNESAQYFVKTKVGYVTDIVLLSNEWVQKIAAGDTEKWVVDVDTVNNIEHIYIKPLEEYIETNIIINTNLRSYRLIVSEDCLTYDFIISFYSSEQDYEKYNELKKIESERFFNEHDNEINMINEKSKAVFNQNYKINKIKNVFPENMPIKIFSTKTKTYIELGDINLHNMPVVYYYDEYEKKKLQLVNYRLKGRLLEIDRTMHQFRILFSQKSYVDIVQTEKLPKNTKKYSNAELYDLLEQSSHEYLENKNSHEKSMIFYEKELAEKQENKAEIKQSTNEVETDTFDDEPDVNNEMGE